MSGLNIMLQEKSYKTLVVEERLLYSEFLERDVIIDVYLPANFQKSEEVSLLLINDGQDLRTMEFAAILDSFAASRNAKPLLCLGIHCGADRMNEYGTVYRGDYKGRGYKAGVYSKFVFNELLPFIRSEYNMESFKEKSFAGFSLGGLSALDLVWNNPSEFTKVGVFSGALWWRRHGYSDESYNPAADRIMHLQVQKGVCRPWLRFFFECGRLDETADRNGNGIIDSIEDTTDLINELKTIGYSNEQLHYTELEDGRHDVETWARAFPEFLKWGWGRQ